jgi:hypothetical protein
MSVLYRFEVFLAKGQIEEVEEGTYEVEEGTYKVLYD